MNTVNELKIKGFTVQASNDAVDCTEVVSPRGFAYFNPRFMDKVEQLGEQLKVASQTKTGEYRLLVAGIYEGNDDFPFAVLSLAEADDLMGHFRQHEAAVEKARIAHERVNAAKAAFHKHYDQLLHGVTA